MSSQAVATATTKAVPEGFKVLQEGQASILQRGNDVFYNPAQVVNRDLSIAVLRQFVQQRQAEVASGEHKKRQRHKSPAARQQQQQQAAANGCKDEPGGIRVLEAMAASGLRAIRYAKEVSGVSRVDAAELDGKVVEAMQRNVEYNDAQAVVHPVQSDCRLLMMQNEGLYDAVDLDPYGSPCHLLDSAMQSVADGGLMMVTATDMAVLCGNNGEACWAKYGCYPLHRPYCHEQAIRILLACLESHANRYKRYIQPLLSLSIDFYTRVFVRVFISPANVKASATKQAYVYQSAGCDSYFLQPVGRKQMKGGNPKYVAGSGPVVPTQCPETGSGFLVGGPIWSEPIHDFEWVQRMYQAVKHNKAQYTAYDRIISVLTAVQEELPAPPLYINLHDVCKTLHCTPPKADLFKSALVNAGYQVSGTHANPLGIKTDAPMSVIWDVMRCWIREHPCRAHDPESYAGRLLAKEPELKADFSRASGALSAAKRSKQARFLPNPQPNWGPKPKHGRVVKAAGGSAPSEHNGHALSEGPQEGGMKVDEPEPVNDAIAEAQQT